MRLMTICAGWSLWGWFALAGPLGVDLGGNADARVAAGGKMGTPTSAQQSVPAGAKITLAVSRREYFLGENVLVHFILENTGTQPFAMSFGGDYRGSSRALRFKVTATDAAGHAADDPDPSPMNFGGLGGTQLLKPGEKFVQSLPLMRYRQIERPGRYTITATHDFGWTAGTPLVGQTAVTFLQPDAAQAERVIAQMEKLPTDPSVSVGQQSRDYADFSCLVQPVYVEPLTRRAKAGTESALEGLGRIPTPEATAALIKLAEVSDAKIALAAAQTLLARLPVAGVARPLSGGEIDPLAASSRLAARAWEPKFVPGVQALGQKFLGHSASREIAVGAALITAVGDTAQAPAALAALQRVLDPLVNDRTDPKDNILDLPEPLPALLRAFAVLHQKGFRLGQGLAGEAQLLLYFEWLAKEPPPRPASWQQTLEAFATGGHFPVREAALRSIPQVVPPGCLELITGRLADPDLGVERIACAVAKRSGDKRFVKPLLELIATEHHEWLLREASDAAQALGAGVELLLTWADRLGDEQLYNLALDSLQTVIADLPGGSSGRTDLSRSERLLLRTSWKEFLGRHAAELRQGRRFRLGDPALSPALFGRARSWQLPDGTSWPKDS